MLRFLAAYQSRFIENEKGTSMVEYALLVALIAVVVIAAALFLGTEIKTSSVKSVKRSTPRSRRSKPVRRGAIAAPLLVRQMMRTAHGIRLPKANSVCDGQEEGERQCFSLWTHIRVALFATSAESA